MEIINHFDRHGKTPDEMYFSSQLENLFQITQPEYLNFLLKTNKIDDTLHSYLFDLIEN